ncbi:LCP family protein [Streptomyces sp. ATCC51928]|uniref:LCP family protein n=1 Tax=Streptomyces caviscabies TaxID=90079 RepID=A0ABW2MJ94_9ACTN|nr:MULTISPECIES: LCP family protein [unclassified Streptomyces]MDX3503690.1 LCP family protein [Streptomyces sp. ATCC51928]MDX5525231.1 LCP family protein [Streptomyces sp. DE06-01C]
MGGPVGRSSTPGERTRSRVRRADQHGWDESLYEDDGPGEGSGDGPDDGGRPGGGGHRATKGRRGGAQGRSSRRAPKSGKRRVLRWSASVLAVLILATGGAGYVYYEYLNSNIKKEDLTLGDKQMADHKANAAGQTPLNILLIGSDARDSKANQKLGGAKETFGAPPLADVQMLLHLSADRSNLSVISMPRDTMLKMPKCTAPDGEVFPASTGDVQTNESLGRGGPGCTVATWYELTGIRIDHFMMIDFAGVVSMADAIGGVPVCVDANIHSRSRDGKGSGLKLEKGTTSIQGEQALQWLRTRYGFEDNTDLGRAKAQHQYMNSMVRQLRKGTKLSDPAKLMNLAEAATKALTVDKGLDTVKKLYDLAEEFKKVPTKRITMSTMPNVYGTGVNNGRVYPKAGDAEQLFRMVRDDVPLDGKASKRKKPQEEPKDPSAPVGEIAVSVRNGTATDALGPASGRAGDVADQLKNAGFGRTTVDSGNVTGVARTGILYPSADLEGDAQAVAKALGVPLSQVKRSTDVSGISLAVGADWREDGAYPVSKGTEKTPESAGALNGEEEGACMKVNPNYTW